MQNPQNPVRDETRRRPRVSALGLQAEWRLQNLRRTEPHDPPQHARKLHLADAARRDRGGTCSWVDRHHGARTPAPGHGVDYRRVFVDACCAIRGFDGRDHFGPGDRTFLDCWSTFRPSRPPRLPNRGGRVRGTTSSSLPGDGLTSLRSDVTWRREDTQEKPQRRRRTNQPQRTPAKSGRQPAGSRRPSGHHAARRSQGRALRGPSALVGSTLRRGRWSARWLQRDFGGSCGRRRLSLCPATPYS